MSFVFETIPGWFDFPDVYDLALERAAPGDRMVEVGTWLGKSAAYMIESIALGDKPLRFTTVDTFLGSPTEPEMQEVVAAHGGSIAAAARANIDRAIAAHPAPPGCEFLVMEADSATAAARFDPGSLRFIFLDGDHTEFAVQRDLAAWLPRLHPDGVIAGHDIDAGGVLAAVRLHIGPRYRTIGRCWWCHASQLC